MTQLGPYRIGRAERLRRIRFRLLLRTPWCAYCGSPLTVATATLDHIKPRSAGGTDRRANLWLACDPCNQKKSCHRLEFLACPRVRGGALLYVTELHFSERTAP